MSLLRLLPFQALDLPAWALMTDRELEELSDSDSEDGEFEEELADSVDLEGPVLCSPRWADLADDEDQDDVLRRDALHLNQCSSPTLCGQGRSASLSLSAASTACPTPVLSPEYTYAEGCPLLPQRWADLADSEDEELSSLSVEFKLQVTPTSQNRWGDFLDSDDDSYFDPTAANKVRPRWADLADIDDDA